MTFVLRRIFDWQHLSPDYVLIIHHFSRRIPFFFLRRTIHSHNRKWLNAFAVIVIDLLKSQMISWQLKRKNPNVLRLLHSHWNVMYSICSYSREATIIANMFHLRLSVLVRHPPHGVSLLPTRNTFLTSSSVMKCIGSGWCCESVSGSSMEHSPSSLCMPTRAEKCPRVYPSTTGDLIQHSDPQSSGR